jgi:hypothetical protein
MEDADIPLFQRLEQLHAALIGQGVRPAPGVFPEQPQASLDFYGEAKRTATAPGGDLQADRSGDRGERLQQKLTRGQGPTIVVAPSTLGHLAESVPNVGDQQTQQPPILYRSQAKTRH